MARNKVEIGGKCHFFWNNLEHDGNLGNFQGKIGRILQKTIQSGADTFYTLEIDIRQKIRKMPFFWKRCENIGNLSNCGNIIQNFEFSGFQIEEGLEYW